MQEWIGLCVLGSSIWVGVDAARLGVRRGGLGGGFVDMGAFGWFLACLLFWIVSFPVYLATRPRYVSRGQQAQEPVYPDPPYPNRFGMPSDAPFTTRATGSDEPWQRDAPVAPPVPNAGFSADRLIRLAELRESGALTDTEFQRLKSDLLRG